MLNIVVALMPEAQPLIEALSLKRRADSTAFSVYSSPSCNLVVSGIGKCNSAAATTWLAALGANQDQVWLNAGIAGTRTEPLGSLFCAHSVEDQAQAKIWYPVQVASPLLSKPLLTTDAPVTDYNNNTLHDMEASGFISAALRFSSAELIQCAKVVSDNTDNPVSAITEPLVRELINDNTPLLQQYGEHLQTLADDLIRPDIDRMLHEFTSRWRFSVTQQRQLQRLLERHQLVIGELTTLPESLQKLRSTSSVLSWLREALSAVPYENAP